MFGRGQNFNKLKIRLLLLLLLSLTQIGRAEIPSAFVDIGYGARPMGMGGAYVAVASDPTAVFWNPAGLTAMYAKQFNLIPYMLASGAVCLNDRHGLGLGLLTSGDDALRESTALLSYATELAPYLKSLSNVSFGLTLKIRQSSFGNNADGGVNQVTGSAMGYGIDLGLRWKIHPRWTTGLLIRDAINSVTYHNETRKTSYGESVPAALIFGSAYLARSNLIFALDWDKALYQDMKDKVSTGCEWMLFQLVFVRAGWSQNVSGTANRKLNWGLGLQYFKKDFGVRFDFAYQTHFLATTPRVSTSIWF
jgi:hypothetical protein